MTNNIVNLTPHTFSCSFELIEFINLQACSQQRKESGVFMLFRTYRVYKQKGGEYTINGKKFVFMLFRAYRVYKPNMKKPTAVAVAFSCSFELIEFINKEYAFEHAGWERVVFMLFRAYRVYKPRKILDGTDWKIVFMLFRAYRVYKLVDHINETLDVIVFMLFRAYRVYKRLW